MVVHEDCSSNIHRGGTFVDYGGIAGKDLLICTREHNTLASFILALIGRGYLIKNFRSNSHSRQQFALVSFPDHILAQESLSYHIVCSIEAHR